MSERAFWDSSLGAIINRINGFRRLEARRDRAAWERTRWLATVTLQPHLRKGKTLKPTDLLRFADEEPQTTKTAKGFDLNDPKRRAALAKSIEKRGWKLPEPTEPNI